MNGRTIRRGTLPSNLLPLLSLILLVAPATVRAGNYFASSKLPVEVQSAHDLYLQGDFDRMVVAIKDALMAYPGDAMIQSDLLDLYDKAYELKGYEAMSPDWRAPATMTWLAVTSVKRFSVARQVAEYRLQISADYSLDQDLEEVQIIRYPDEVLIDRQAGIGEIIVKPVKGFTDFWMGASYHRAPNASGLYLLTLKMKGQEPIHGWFILGKDANPTGSPELVYPKKDQVLASGTPSFSWKEYLSPEYKPFEKRKVIAFASRRAPDAVDTTWWVSLDPPALSASVGANVGNVWGATSLAPDQYTFHASYREMRKFGDVRISRESGTVVPFSVK